jgi:hypothetical protein
MLMNIRDLQQEYFKLDKFPVNCQSIVLYGGISIAVH